MANVPKNMAATASAMPLAIGAREKGEEERALVRRAQKGDERAFEDLVRRHQQRVFGLVARILHRQDDVEDIAQQVFLKVYLSLNRFDQRAAFSTWLYKIAVNECWDYLRKKKVRRLVYEADLSEEQVRKLDALPEHDYGGPSHLEDTPKRLEQRQLLDRLLAELDDKDQLMLVMKEVEGFSVEEIGEVLGLNVNTVKVRLFRARGRLVEMYRKRMQKRPLSRNGLRARRSDPNV